MFVASIIVNKYMYDIYLELDAIVFQSGPFSELYINGAAQVVAAATVLSTNAS